MAKRIITKKEEQAIRLCHHDFEGLSRKEAAKIMGVTLQALSNILRRVKQKAPQLFPILTKTQKYVYDELYKGFTRQELVFMTGMTLKEIDNTIQQLHKKGFDVQQPKQTVSYEDWMDNQIVEKF